MEASYHQLVSLAPLLIDYIPIRTGDDSILISTLKSTTQSSPPTSYQLSAFSYQYYHLFVPFSTVPRPTTANTMSQACFPSMLTLLSAGGQDALKTCLGVDQRPSRVGGGAAQAPSNLILTALELPRLNYCSRYFPKKDLRFWASHLHTWNFCIFNSTSRFFFCPAYWLRPTLSCLSGDESWA
jgi:hypothetical protein